MGSPEKCPGHGPLLFDIACCVSDALTALKGTAGPDVKAAVSNLEAARALIYARDDAPTPPAPETRTTCPWCEMAPSAGRHANFAYCGNPCHTPTPPAPADGIQHDMETRCPKCGKDYRLHKGDEVECVCPAPADDASGAEAMREAARALFDLGCANGGDPGVVSYDSAEIHASLDRIFDKAWRDSPLYALPLPAPASGAVEEARKAFYEAARGMGAIFDHRDRVYGSLDGPVFVQTYRALMAAEAAERADRGGNNKGGPK